MNDLTNANRIILKRVDRLDSKEKLKSQVEQQIVSLWSQLKFENLKTKINKQQEMSQILGKFRKNQKEPSRINGVW